VCSARSSELGEAFGEDVANGRILIRQRFNQSDLAAMAGIARETINRVLQDWTKQAMVSRRTACYSLSDLIEDGLRHD
jgi:CRP/FNR family transcriptional regulator, cyclic AMP receptor protein